MAADPAAKQKPDPRSELLGTYLAHLSHQRHLAAGTRRNYHQDIEALFALNPEVALERIEPQHIRRSVAQLHARGLSGRRAVAFTVAVQASRRMCASGSGAA